jgi:hypothetical protein
MCLLHFATYLNIHKKCRPSYKSWSSGRDEIPEQKQTAVIRRDLGQYKRKEKKKEKLGATNDVGWLFIKADGLIYNTPNVSI